MPFLPITALYASICALILLYLAYDVVRFRQSQKKGLGHDTKELLVAGRNHANAAEYMPITLLLLALAEVNGAATLILHALGLSFVIARFGHAYGFKKGLGKVHMGRFYGTLFTWISIFALVLLNLWLSWPFFLL